MSECWRCGRHACGCTGSRPEAEIRQEFCRLADAVGVPETVYPGAPTARRRVSYADRRRRQLALYLAVVARGLPVRHVAFAAGVTPRGVRHALSMVEERRDDPNFDRQISQLEERLTCLQ